MNKLLFTLLLGGLFLSIASCKKDNNYSSDDTATVNVLNGIVSQDVMLNTNGRINNSLASGSYNGESILSYGQNLFFYAEAKNTPITILKANDSSTLATKSFDFAKDGIYTLLLSGISPNVETILIDDSKMPYVNLSKSPSDADSVINIRFINLCPDASPLDIRLQGSTIDEVTGLAYKNYTVFSTYPAKVVAYAGTLGYSILTFEVLENGIIQNTHDVFVYFTNRFKNLALVVTGLESNGSLDMKEMPYYQN